MDQIQYWVALNRVPRLGTVRFGRLEAYFGQLENAWNADLGQLKSAGIEGRAAREIISARSRVSPDDEMERLRQAGVMAINWHHPDYPARLKEISNPPPVLYYKGTLLAADERSVAVVGTRSPTTYGREAAANLTADLARCGITIISGMALGIDGIAHHSALDQGARTIALLAGGLDIIYPREHTRLFQQIQENGAVVSEIPLGIRPDSRSFPRRNRLIQEGSKLVLNHNDVLEELNLSSVAHQIEMRLAPDLPDLATDDEEKKLLAHLENEPLHIDEIRRRAGLPIAQISGLLTMLEIKRLVKQVGCMHYVMIREATPTYGN